MTKRRRFLAFALVVMALASGCGSPQKVGSEELLDFTPQPDAEAIGREPDETEKPLTIGGTPTPKPTTAPTTPAPKATPVIFDITLVTNSPFYKPGNCIKVAEGVTIRVTNKDATPERAKGRSFTDKAGTFHSGLMKPGQEWTYLFPRGSYDIIDEGLTFASAVLHVGEGSC